MSGPFAKTGEGALNQLRQVALQLDAKAKSSESGSAPQLISTLEDRSFCARSLLRTRLLGEEVTAVHESLDVPRMVSQPVRLMLPWRMPRRA
jgi:carotenoid 1,2-hydratase